MKQFEAEYDGRDVIAHQVEDKDGGEGAHRLLTADGTVDLRTGDYVIYGLRKTPRDMVGYHSDTVPLVVRSKNGKPVGDKLTIGDPVEAPEEEEDTRIDMDDDDDLVPAAPKKSANPLKTAPPTVKK